MIAFLFNFLLLTAETGAVRGGESGWDKFLHFYSDYLNYPGFEAWRFLNLAIFIAIMV